MKQKALYFTLVSVLALLIVSYYKIEIANSAKRDIADLASMGNSASFLEGAKVSSIKGKKVFEPKTSNKHYFALNRLSPDFKIMKYPVYKDNDSSYPLSQYDPANDSKGKNLF